MKTASLQKQCSTCKYFAFDMDDVYCTHKKSFDESPTYGLSLNAMSRSKLCTHGDKGKYELWEPKPPATKEKGQ